MEKALYFNDHQEVAALLRGLCEALPGLGAQLELYEIGAGRSRRISLEYLMNILQRADDELARQKLLMEQEQQDDG